MCKVQFVFAMYFAVLLLKDRVDVTIKTWNVIKILQLLEVKSPMKQAKMEKNKNIDCDKVSSLVYSSSKFWMNFASAIWV